MSLPSALTAILRTQSYSGLDAINRELCDNRIKRNGGKERYVQRLRRSLKNSLENNDITWKDILEVLQADDEARTRTRIRDCLESITFSKTTSQKEGEEAIEHYVTAEVFQALQWKFQDDGIEVYDEKWQNKSIGRPDITVLDGDDKYVVEVKTSSLGAMRKLKEQVKRYKEIDGFRWLIVLYVTTKPRMALEKNSKRKNMVAGLKGHYKRLTVVDKGPDSFYPTK